MRQAPQPSSVNAVIKRRGEVVDQRADLGRGPGTRRKHGVHGDGR